MAYIGKQPVVGNFQVCDAISVVNGQAAYTMQVSSVNVVPETANHMIVSLNGIIQKPGSSFTVSGSTITFASNLVTGDVIDFIHILGSVLDLGVPSDATVTNAKTNFVSTSSAAGLQIKGDGTTDGTLQLNCSQNSHGIKLKSPAHSTSSSYTLTFPGTDPSADKFLKTDGSGNLSFADAGGGAFEKLVTTTVSSAVSELVFNNTYFTTSHVDYQLRIVDFRGTAGAVPRFTISSDNGSNYKGGSGSTGYRFGYSGTDHTTNRTTRVSGGNDDANFILPISGDGFHGGSTQATSLIIDIFDPLNTLSDSKMFNFMASAVCLASNDEVEFMIGGGVYNGSGDEDTAFNAIKIFMDSGNIDGGTFTLYGRKI